MNIEEAKKEIRQTIELYLERDKDGRYRIPRNKQRPLFLIGPPGIGKTAIMEQIAKECELGLVSYTITHHTRQSIIGLPFISEKKYANESFHITEYTMSEIISSIYECIQNTGIEEGILFLDEINCVSETLAPMMLQFLQEKRFGNFDVPDGWIIVTAGNPVGYNKSVREFDTATKDRIRQIEVEPNYKVWKKYAISQGVHSSITSFLEIKKENLYHIENSVDDSSVVTPRAWEDFSIVLEGYERHGFTVDYEVAQEFIKSKKIAIDFVNFLELYHKYEDKFKISKILDGRAKVYDYKDTSFDERISLISMLVSGLNEHFMDVYKEGEYLKKFLKAIRRTKQEESIAEILQSEEKEYRRLSESKLIDGFNRENYERLIEELRKMQPLDELNLDERLKKISEIFNDEKETLNRLVIKTKTYLKNALDFLENYLHKTNKDEYELDYISDTEIVYFITELETNYYSMNFLREYGIEEIKKYSTISKNDMIREELKEEIMNNL